MRREHERGLPFERQGTIALSIGLDQWGALVLAAFCGAAPVTTWLSTLALPFHALAPKSNAVLGSIMVALSLFAVLVAPWLLPSLVLRARQPRGARIEWNEEEVTEWDGPWRKTVIPWSQVELATKTWIVRAVSTTTHHGVQLFARNGSGVITVWTAAPEDAPKLRRRLVSNDTMLLELAAKHHGIEPTRAPDWSLAADPDRPPHRLATILGRFGYVAAMTAPLLVPGPGSGARSRFVALAVTAAGTALLGLRAVPSFREVRAIRARLRSGPALSNDGPYRGASARLDEADADGRGAADRLKLRAATAELAVRALCVMLVLASTAVAFGALALNKEP